MRADEMNPEPMRSGLAKKVRETRDGTANRASPKQTPAADHVVEREITEASRTSAPRPDARPDDEAAPKLGPERIMEIRFRILKGAYASVEVVDEVARRMLERGDV